jgi:hypothetical protein
MEAIGTSSHAAGMAWAPCGTCWGQRQILEPALNGEGLIGVACTTCLGSGETLRGGSEPI